MVYTLVIRNCKLPLFDEIIEGDLLIDGEKIAGFSKSGLVQADRYYDAKGLLVLPGGVDVHVHFRDPSSNKAEDFETGSLAAAHGGVTTVADMPNTEPPVTDVEALRLKLERIGGKSYVDYMLYGGAGKMTIANIMSLAREGVAGIKTFMISRFPALLSPDTETIKAAILETKKTNIPLLIHAEDLSVINHVGGGGGAKSYAIKRGCLCESLAVARVAELNKHLKGHVHFVHISCADSLRLIRFYKDSNTQITVETTPHYLSLTMDELERRGPYAKVDPPLRTREDVEELLRGLCNGDIDFIASDHAPHMKEEKEKGFKDIELAPSGMPGVETTLPFLLNLFNRGVLSLRRLVEVFSTNPAKFLGIYPRKGALQINADADLVLVNPKEEFKVSSENLLTKTKQSIFEGMSFIGKPVATFLRGVLIMEGMEVYSKPIGLFIKRLNPPLVPLDS
ncbi:MAG: dihydroorotase family protein [Nitrososphaerales archaeon]|nr:dihydroorotase family protein [Nitrososphaerales archaeon]